MTAVTIYLLFQLFAGEVVEVDAFMDRDQCEEARETASSLFKSPQAQAARPDLAKRVLPACVGHTLEAPAGERA